MTKVGPEPGQLPRPRIFPTQETDGSTRERVLFLCRHNSARSQMAGGLLRRLAGDRFEVFSAGTEATHVRPQAITVMGELGIDISGQTSKTVEQYREQPFDYVVTVCDQAHEACPIFPIARRRRHWSLPDPSQEVGDATAQLAVFRDVRDQLAERLHAFMSQGVDA